MFLKKGLQFAVKSVFAFSLLLGGLILPADNWPTYMRNDSRTSITDVNLKFPMRFGWKYSPEYPPSPSWPSPAKQDFWHYLPKLTPTTVFDRVFHTITVKGKIVFASSADGIVRCLDAISGRMLWEFVTNAPIRLAPYYTDGKLYCASDDGYLYCLDMQSGKKIWKYWAGGEMKRYLPGNGRMISRWPIRAGIVSDDKYLYFAAGLFPKEEVFLCSINKKTGKQNYKKNINIPAQGYMTLHNDHLYIPVGRNSQIAFNVSNGNRFFSLFPGDSSAVYNQLVFSGQNERGESAIYSSVTKKIIAKLKARQIIVSGTKIFILRNDKLSAVDKKSFLKSSEVIYNLSKIKKRTGAQDAELKKAVIARGKSYIWTSQIFGNINMVLSSNAIVLGCVNKVLAISKKDGKKLWMHKTDGKIYGLNVTANRITASSTSGTIYSFVPGRPESLKKKGDIDIQPVAKPVSMRNYHNSILNAWRFTKSNLKNFEIIDLAHKHNIPIQHSATFANIGAFKVLKADDNLSINIANQSNIALLPQKPFSVEACVLLTKTIKWGGIIGAFQDNGSYEKGWVLGYNEDKFVFGLATEGGKGKMTYLESNISFKINKWYDIAGVYDGKTMSIYVNGKFAGSSQAQSGKILYPPEFFYDIGAYHDKNENNKMSGLILEVCVYGSALKKSDINAAYSQLIPLISKAKKFTPEKDLSDPVVTFSPRGLCSISFPNAIVDDTHLAYGTNSKKIEKKILLKNNFISISHLKPNTEYYYTLIDNVGKKGKIYTFKTPFNPFMKRNFGKKNAQYVKYAKTILKTAGFRKGYCYVYDFGDGELGYELVKHSDLNVIGIGKDPARIAKVRAKFAKLGLYGTRITVFNANDKIKFQSKTGNIVTSGSSFKTGKLPSENINDLYELTRPCGGALLFIMPSKNAHPPKKPVVSEFGWSKKKYSHSVVYFLKRPKIKNSGEWTHLYADLGETACSNEQLVGGDMEMQWFGPPGPEQMADRHHRQMSPLFINGNLFVLGDNYLYGVDGYNGTLLWQHIIPKSRRLGVMYDTGIMAADRRFVYVGSGNKCLAIYGKTGRLFKTYSVPYKNHDWGYIAINKNTLIGSGQPVNASWNKLGRINLLMEGDFKLFACSRNIFSYNSNSGKLNWKYNKGIIINPTIVQGDGKIFFVESDNKKLLKMKDGRFGLKSIFDNSDASLVALDVKSGKEVWCKKFSPPFRNIIFLNYSDNVLVASGSYNVGKFVKYSLIGFDAKTGKRKWTTESSLEGAKIRGSHGEQWQHPAIVNGKIFLQSHVIDLQTGETIKNLNGWARSGGGCGTVSCSADTLFFRSGYPRSRNIKSGKIYKLTKATRPGCWINIIPAGGLVLIPEASSGCTCSYAIQSSIALAPKK